jgi:hypothetical protein
MKLTFVTPKLCQNRRNRCGGVGIFCYQNAKNRQINRDANHDMSHEIAPTMTIVIVTTIKVAAKTLAN